MTVSVLHSSIEFCIHVSLLLLLLGEWAVLGTNVSRMAGDYALVLQVICNALVSLGQNTIDTLSGTPGLVRRGPVYRTSVPFYAYCNISDRSEIRPLVSVLVLD